MSVATGYDYWRWRRMDEAEGKPIALLGNEADAEMEEARAADCHRDVLDAMGIGS